MVDTVWVLTGDFPVVSERRALQNGPAVVLPPRRAVSDAEFRRRVPFPADVEPGGRVRRARNVSSRGSGTGPEGFSSVIYGNPDLSYAHAFWKN